MREPEVAKARKPGLSQKQAMRLAEVEAALARLGGELAALDRQLSEPGAFARAESPGHALLRSRDVLQADLEALEQEWIELEETRGSALS